MERALSLGSTGLLCYSGFGHENRQNTHIHACVCTWLFLCTHIHTQTHMCTHTSTHIDRELEAVSAPKHLHFSGFTLILHNVMRAHHTCCWDGAHAHKTLPSSDANLSLGSKVLGLLVLACSAIAFQSAHRTVWLGPEGPSVLAMCYWYSAVS